jgi:hypothetical protein
MKKALKVLAIVSAIGAIGYVPEDAQAADLSVLFGGWSNHSTTQEKERSGLYGFKKDYKYNESHNMIGFKYNNCIVSTFKNSFYKRSVFIGYNYNLFGYDLGNFSQRFSVAGGFVTGYKKEQTQTAYIAGGVSLYLMPTITTTYNINNTYSLSINNGIMFADTGSIVTTNLSFNIKF